MYARIEQYTDYPRDTLVLQSSFISSCTKEEVRRFTIVYVDAHNVTNAAGEGISSVTM